MCDGLFIHRLCAGTQSREGWRQPGAVGVWTPQTGAVSDQPAGETGPRVPQCCVSQKRYTRTCTDVWTLTQMFEHFNLSIEETLWIFCRTHQLSRSLTKKLATRIVGLLLMQNKDCHLSLKYHSYPIFNIFNMLIQALQLDQCLDIWAREADPLTKAAGTCLLSSHLI